MSNLSDFMPKKLDSVKGKPIVVVDVEECQGQRGIYALINAQDEDGQILVLRTSGSSIIRALRTAKIEGKLPINATFDKDGAVWVAKET